MPLCSPSKNLFQQKAFSCHLDRILHHLFLLTWFPTSTFVIPSRCLSSLPKSPLLARPPPLPVRYEHLLPQLCGLKLIRALDLSAFPLPNRVPVLSVNKCTFLRLLLELLLGDNCTAEIVKETSPGKSVTQRSSVKN